MEIKMELKVSSGVRQSLQKIGFSKLYVQL